MGVELSKDKYLNEKDGVIDLFDVFYSSSNEDNTDDYRGGKVKVLQSLCIDGKPIGLLASDITRSWGSIIYSKKLTDYGYYPYNVDNKEENKKNNIEFLLKKRSIPVRSNYNYRNNTSLDIRLRL